MSITTVKKTTTPSSIAEQDRPLAEYRVILDNVSWHTFENLLTDLGDRRTTLYEPIIRGKEAIIVGQDPPPDLVLEVDITNPSDLRLPIYALLNVPELWRYDGYSLEFLALVNGEYQPIEKSLAFPDLPAVIIVEYVQKRLTLGESATLREFRKWVRANVVAD